MALESCGTSMAKQIDAAFKLCHDVIREEGFETAQKSLKMGIEGMWSVIPSKLDGNDAVEIRICVG